MRYDVSYCNGRGGNKACKLAHKYGRSMHIIPLRDEGEHAIVLPTYHYHDTLEAITAFNEACESAPVVQSDDELYEYRRRQMAYKLAPGWIDPTRRTTQDWINYNKNRESR